VVVEDELVAVDVGCGEALVCHSPERRVVHVRQVTDSPDLQILEHST